MKTLKELKELIPGLKIDSDVTEEMQDVFFHCGVCTTFPYQGGEVQIMSQGDIVIQVNGKGNAQSLCRFIKRTDANTNIREELRELSIRTDQELADLFEEKISTLSAYAEVAPWWEIQYVKDGIIYDLEWVSDDDSLGLALEEAFNNIQDYLDHYDIK